MLYFTFK